MIAYDREDQIVYKNRKLGWRHSPPDAPPPVLAYGPEETMAYGHYFFPSRYAIQRRICSELKKIVPNFQPKTVLDFGCGPGTGYAAAASVWNPPPPRRKDETDKEFVTKHEKKRPFELPQNEKSPSTNDHFTHRPAGPIKRYIGVDLSRSMLDAAKIMTEGGTGTDFIFFDRLTDVVKLANTKGDRYDLVLCAFTLGELTTDPARRAATQLLFELVGQSFESIL
jgi:SAM-dependent methyltransferase